MPPSGMQIPNNAGSGTICEAFCYVTDISNHRVCFQSETKVTLLYLNAFNQCVLDIFEQKANSPQSQFAMSTFHRTAKVT